MSAKYYIYRNLHKDLFSIRHKGRVIDRDAGIVAEGIQFKVNESGRQRVISEKKKNVHAFVVADKYYRYNGILTNCKKISYNPYAAGYFTCEGKRIEYADKVYFGIKGNCYLIE